MKSSSGIRACLPIMLLASTLGVCAQDYPVRPVRLIVPYPPGGGNDTLARIFGQKLAERWGQQIVIDNRPGAGTTIGASSAAKAPGDGYTLLLSSVATHALAPALYAKPGYDPIKDFVAVTTLVTSLAMNFVHRGAYFPEAPTPPAEAEPQSQPPQPLPLPLPQPSAADTTGADASSESLQSRDRDDLKRASR